jgi:type I restriction enzyme, S subunit
METSEKLITENLDVWTSVVKAKSSAGRGSRNKRELYGIQKLRGLILELAVQGLLVPQDANDEPASAFLKRSAEAKARLLEEKKIKKQKPLNPIDTQATQFSLPQGWQWEKLGNLVEMYNGRSFKSSEWGTEGLPIVRIQNLNDEHASFNYFAGELSDNHHISDGTFLISWSGTPGTSFGAFIWKRGDAALNQHINKCQFHSDETDLKFMKLVVSGQMNHFISKAQGGVGLKHVTKGTLNNAVLPIPPLAEQHRIVAKVDELMALCDQLEQEQESSIAAHDTLVATLLNALTETTAFAEAWQRIQANFDTLFTTESSIDQLKQTILQLAVMGKLVEQDPEDEPAAELLKSIAAKKAELIKEKKIKKQPKLPPVDESEFPFSPPSGWRFERIGNLTSKLGSGSTPRGGKSAYVPDGIIFLRSQNVWNDGLKLDDTAYIPEETHAAMNNTQVFPRDVLLNITGASLGRSTVFPENLATANVSQHVTIIRLVEPEMAEFLHLGILSPLVQKLVWGRQVGMAIEGLSKKVLEKFEFPIPPLAEQHRIVAKVDELMALCDQLKASLATAQTTQLNLADSLVDAAIN